MLKNVQKNRWFGTELPFSAAEDQHTETGIQWKQEGYPLAGVVVVGREERLLNRVKLLGS